MQWVHADRFEAMPGEGVTDALQRCHVQPLLMKKARKFGPNMVAPAGFEPLLGGSGDSRPLPIRVIF